MPARPETRAILEKAAADLGLTFTGVASAPAGAALKLDRSASACGIDTAGRAPAAGSAGCSSGTSFRFDVVYAQDTRRWRTRDDRYDVVILTDEAVPDGRDASERADRHPSGVPANDRFVDDRAFTARAEGVRRGWRHADRGRAIDVDRDEAGAAGVERARRDAGAKARGR